MEQQKSRCSVKGGRGDMEQCKGRVRQINIGSVTSAEKEWVTESSRMFRQRSVCDIRRKYRDWGMGCGRIIEDRSEEWEMEQQNENLVEKATEAMLVQVS
jgi:hypothetical protein